jgi:hypothetical protein
LALAETREYRASPNTTSEKMNNMVFSSLKIF